MELVASYNIEKKSLWRCSSKKICLMQLVLSFVFLVFLEVCTYKIPSLENCRILTFVAFQWLKNKIKFLPKYVPIVILGLYSIKSACREHRHKW